MWIHDCEGSFGEVLGAVVGDLLQSGATRMGAAEVDEGT